MKSAKIILELLKQVEIKSVKPWQDNYTPSEDQIIKGPTVFEPKTCSLCGEVVPLTWNIENKNIVDYSPPTKTPDLYEWNKYEKNWMYSPEARELHPKCNKLLERLHCWGIKRKNIVEIDSFVVDDKNKYAYTMVTKWIKNPSTLGLYLYGSWGTGKTMLCTKVILEGSFDTRLIIKEAEIYEQLTPQIDNSSRQADIEENMDFFKSVSFLVIDDLGGSKYSDWKTEKMFEILSERMDSMLPTFFTSNYSPLELRDRMDGKIVSRVFGLADPCEIGGHDHRLDRK